MSFSIFFTIVLALYILVNSYLFVRLVAATGGAARIIATSLLLLLSISFPAGRILSRIAPGRLSSILIFVGTLYLAPMIYAFLLTAAADIFRLANSFVRLAPSPRHITTSTRIAAATALMAVLISLAGFVNASAPSVKYFSLDLFEPASDLHPGSFVPNRYIKETRIREDASSEPIPDETDDTETIRIVALSDIHLGRFVTGRHLERLVELTYRQQPDIVLLLGDMIDDLSWMDNPGERSRIRMGFRMIYSKMGVWAILGNHDYYAGAERVTAFMEEMGVTLLRDGWAMAGDRLLLIGRDDRTAGERRRRPLLEIRDEAADALGAKFEQLSIIVLDHQPVNLEDSRDAGAALQLSGHTHRGQLFPCNFIVAKLFKKHYGTYRDGGTNYYISSGAGTWGPPVRTTGRPEIVVIDLKLKR